MRLDARTKTALMLVYSASLFFVESWAGLACMAALLVCAGVAAGASMRGLPALAAPACVLAAFVVLLNSFEIVPAAALANAAESGLYPLVGAFCLSIPGFASGCYYAVRLLLLASASLMTVLATTATELADAFGSLLRPLRRLGVPVEDAATALAIALRLIPVMALELRRVHGAQLSRCAKFGEGSPPRRLGAWVTVLIALFAALFRRADALALAMDARCYGARESGRTTLAERKLTPTDTTLMLATTTLCITLAVVF